MKRIAWILIFALFFCGCARQETPRFRVVTGVQIQYQQEGSALTRTYTQPASIRSVLTYLRILRPFGPVTPETSGDITCKFTLKYSHGPDRVILQQGNNYLRTTEDRWEKIDSSRATLLYPLLLLLPSDE